MNAVEAIYAQVSAPDWARPNLDGLLDVLRDLSWLPEGEVVLVIPADADAYLADVLLVAEVETAHSPRPVRARRQEQP